MDYKTFSNTIERINQTINEQLANKTELELSSIEDINALFSFTHDIFERVILLILKNRLAKEYAKYFFAKILESIILIDYWVKKIVYKQKNYNLENAAHFLQNNANTLLLQTKAEEYTDKQDYLASFKLARKYFQEIGKITYFPIYYACKHMVSILAFLDGNIELKINTFNEKLGDIYNYILLLYCLYQEGR